MLHIPTELVPQAISGIVILTMIPPAEALSQELMTQLTYLKQVAKELHIITVK